jgi:hypothetical protein
LTVKSNSFNATHPRYLNELENKLVEAGMTLKVAMTTSLGGIEESGKPTRSCAACFCDSAKQTSFWDMAMALANELASCNIMVEKWDSSKIDAARGAALRGSREGPKVTQQQGRAHPTHWLSSIQNQNLRALFSRR